MIARRRKTFLALGAIIVAAFVFVRLREGHARGIVATNVTRTALAEGVELVEARLVRRGDDVGHLAIVYADLDAVDLEIAIDDGTGPSNGIADLLPGALLVTNAAYFTEKRRATGLLASHGRIINPFVARAGSGVFLVEDGRAQLLERDSIDRRDFTRAKIAIQAGPRIVENGGAPGIRGDDGLRANRTFVGADREGRLLLGVAYMTESGSAKGPTLYELQALLLEGALAEEDASLTPDFLLNLDGGPSTGFDLRSKSRPRRYAETTRVHSVLAVSLER